MHRHLAVFAFACLILVTCSGCPQYADPRVPEPILTMKEPAWGGEYLVYTPSRYRHEEASALVILCHGTTPWDTPLREIRDWVKLAEEKRFIVAAPHLKGTRGDFPPPADKQIAYQREDERRIMATLRHLQGAKNIDENRIFLAGWSAGGFAVLHTGLRNPDIFRALAVLQGNFDSAYLGDAVEQIDPYQPVMVLRGTADLLTNVQGKECADWLYENNAYVFDDAVPGPHRCHPQVAYEFFERIVRQVPFMRIVAEPVDESHPFSIRFSTRGSFEPVAYEWSLGGDDAQSPVARPEHTFRDAGTYDIRLLATDAAGQRIRRYLRLTVPVATLSHRLDR